MILTYFSLPLFTTRLVRYCIESRVCPLLPIRSPILSPRSSTLTHSSSVSNVILTSTEISIASNISLRKLLILDSISSLDNTALSSALTAVSSLSASTVFSVAKALCSAVLSLTSTAFSALTASFLEASFLTSIVSLITFFSFFSNSLNSSSTESTPDLTLALIFAGFELNIPNKPLLPLSITSYSILSLDVSSLRQAFVIASSTDFPVTSIYSMFLPSLTLKSC